MKASKRKAQRNQRSGVGYQNVVASLRCQILNGEFAAGERLPTHMQLQQRFGTTPVTVQRAIHALVNEGFVRTRQRCGLFVVDRLPHLHEYALVFHSEPVQTTWSKYYVALTNAAVAIQQEERRRLLLFYGIDRHVDTEDYQRLLGYLRAHRLAGVIFDNAPHVLVGTPLVEETDIPRVAFMSLAEIPGVMAVGFDGRAFVARALDHLAGRGRKRVAIISGPGTSGIEQEYLDGALSARSLFSPSRWRIPLSPMGAEAASKCVELLMQGSSEQRPDALVVMDDNLVEQSLAGLVTAGMRVPQDLDVVVHCNFPCPPATVLPVKRLGFDTRQALRAGMALIDARRRGEPATKFQLLPPVFEEELPLGRPAVARATADAAVAAVATPPK